MTRLRPRRRLPVWLAVAGTCLPAQAFAVGDKAGGPSVATPPPLQIADVQLQAGGVLVGQVVDADGHPWAGGEVALLSTRETIAATRTDAQGTFAVAGLRGGVHQIRVDDTIQTCRLWAPDTAPPGANHTAQVVTGRDVVRGQWGPPPGNRFLRQAKVWATNPFVVGGIVAAAVAIPIALSDDDDPHS